MLGLEKTLEEYVEKMVQVFRGVRRVLRKDGTLWLNLGDSYAGGGNNRGNNSPLFDKQASNGGAIGQVGWRDVPAGLKPKDLCGIPWRVAFALQADGWWLRSCITLAKKNPMPESTTDRPTKASEMMFLLTKSQNYYYDQTGANEGCRYVNEPHLSNLQAIEIAKSVLLEEGRASGDLQGLFQGSRCGLPTDSEGNAQATDLESEASADRQVQRLLQKVGTLRKGKGGAISSATEVGENGKGQSGDSTKTFQRQRSTKSPEQSHGGAMASDQAESGQQMFLLRESEAANDGSHNTDQQRRPSRQGERGGSMSAMQQPETQQTRNLRDVWWFATVPYPECHFATFSPEIVKPCIMAGTSAKGCCARCGAPWERIVRKSGGTTGKSWHEHENDLQVGQRGGTKDHKRATADGYESDYKVETLGWQAGCKCDAGIEPCVCLDPFAGSGTTGAVALELGRKAVLIELNPHYVALIEQRCNVTLGMALA